MSEISFLFVTCENSPLGTKIARFVQLILTHFNFTQNAASISICHFEMAGWVGRSVYVDFIGCNAEQLSQEIKDMLFEKIKSFSRRPPVRAKVVLIENDNVTEEDQIGIP